MREDDRLHTEKPDSGHQGKGRDKGGGGKEQEIEGRFENEPMSHADRLSHKAMTFGYR